MKPEVLLKQIKKQSADLLIKHPEERKNSTGYVYDNLEVKHVKAALYMMTNNGFGLNAYNLHDLIANWDQYKMIAELSPTELVLHDATDIEPGAFNPKHLLEYFITEQKG